MRVTHHPLSEEVRRGRRDTNTVARFDDVTTFAELLPALAELRPHHAPARLLCTLDDVAQCLYTSGHAAEDDRLWYDTGVPEETDPATRRSRDDARTAHVAAALDAPASRVEWRDLPGTRTSSEEDVTALAELNHHPDAALDDVVLVQRVPVPRDDLAVAGFPNGYFTADWNVFQNHAIIRRLSTHGYTHIGIGAALLGFTREKPLTPPETEAVVADLKHLYGAEKTPAWQDLATLLPQRQLLLLGYTEDFAELLA